MRFVDKEFQKDFDEIPESYKIAFRKRWNAYYKRKKILQTRLIEEVKKFLKNVKD